MKAKRARGRAYRCPCGQERFVLSHRGIVVIHGEGRGQREAEAEVRRQGAEAFAFGECGAGVALKFDGARVVGSREARPDEVNRIRALPAVRVDDYTAMVASLTEPQRIRLQQIETALHDRAGHLVVAGVEIGNLLLDANRLLAGHKRFGLFLERLKIAREKAFTAMRIAQAVAAMPQCFGTFQKIGQEKTAILMRLPEARRIELLEQGVPINGHRVPIIEVSFRPLNAVVRSIVGKSARGRKPKTNGDDGKGRDRFGLPADLADPLLDALQAFHGLRAAVKRGLHEKHHVAVDRLWKRIARQFHELNEDYHLGELLELDRRK
jgi:hypothetical protein